MRIIHVTETLVAGVLAAVAALANAQSELGHDVSIVYSAKPLVPSTDELDHRLHPNVRRVEVPFRGRPASIWDLEVAVAAIARTGVDVVHAHSTFAGFACRLRPRIRRRARVLAYSPHGWAFLRGASSALSNRTALTIERRLARRCHGLVLVSESEAEIGRKAIQSSRIHVLQNGIPVDALPISTGSGQARPVVITTGRIMEQKAPDRFAAIASALSDRADFIWIGDGDEDEKHQWIGDAPVQVSGWLPHDEVVRRLAAADIFLFPTRWEGMPIALMEAQAIGLPAVATDIVGNRDVVLDGETGMLRDDTEALIAAVTRLVVEDDLRHSMRATTVAIQRSRLSDEKLGETSVAIYQELADTR